MNKDVREVVERILDNHKDNKLSVIAVLQDVQEELRYLPKEAFEIIKKWRRDFQINGTLDELLTDLF